MEREPQNSPESPKRLHLHQKDLCGQLTRKRKQRVDHEKYGTDIPRRIEGSRNSQSNGTENRSVLERRRPQTGEREEIEGSIISDHEISLCSSYVTPRATTNGHNSQTRQLLPGNSSDCASLEGANTRSDETTFNKPNVAIASFNCFNWKSDIMRSILEDLSENHTRDIILALQETWKYEIPAGFRKEFQEQYHFVHESAMNVNQHRRKGRPYGGIAFIISRSIAFQIKYTNSRCLSILLTHHNILVHNVYMPSQDRRQTVEVNMERLMEALGHFEAAHGSTDETVDCIALGDFNASPLDNTERSRMINRALEEKSYDLQTDTKFLPPTEYSHKAGRLIDRIVATTSISNIFSSVNIKHSYYDSDHFPIVATVAIESQPTAHQPIQNTSLCWSKATEKAIFSYSQLLEKKCKKTLNKFSQNKINGAELYSETVQNMQDAAFTCIPKCSNKVKKRHNIPMWRERMTSFQSDVEYWTQLQFLHGGPNHCPIVITQQLRLSKSRYRHQIRQLRREVESNIAEATTLQNCHKQLFKKTKSPAPAMIDGHSRAAQPEMWRKHFREVFNADEFPYQGNLLNDISAKLTNADIQQFKYVQCSEINDILPLINSDKSYKQHHH